MQSVGTFSSLNFHSKFWNNDLFLPCISPFSYINLTFIITVLFLGTLTFSINRQKVHNFLYFPYNFRLKIAITVNANIIIVISLNQHISWCIS
jgi:hypothetical protein